jgi:Rieske Fe-S protein
MIGDRIPSLRAPSINLNTLRENQGSLIRLGSKMIAAYRDPEGEVHLMSPVCPHLGCYVNWNEAEKSWDCPCHGSRFSPTGRILNGPAIADLSTASVDIDEGPFIAEKYDQEQKSGTPLGSPLLTFSLPLCPCRIENK